MLKAYSIWVQLIYYVNIQFHTKITITINNNMNLYFSYDSHKFIDTEQSHGFSSVFKESVVDLLSPFVGAFVAGLHPSEIGSPSEELLFVLFRFQTEQLHSE